MPTNTQWASPVKECGADLPKALGWDRVDSCGITPLQGALLSAEPHDVQKRFASRFQEELFSSLRFSLAGIETIQLQQQLRDVQARLDTVERAVSQITERHGTALEQIKEGFVGALRGIGDVHCVAAVEDAEGYRVVTFMDGWDIEAERAVYRVEHNFLQTAGDILIDFVLVPNADEETITEASSQMTVLYDRR